MKNPLPLLIGFLFFLWLMLGSFLTSRHCNCGGMAAMPVVVAPPTTEEEPSISITIADTDKGFRTGAAGNLLFPPNACDYNKPISDSLRIVFNNVAAHLQSKADRILVLTGLRYESETNLCGSNDLGVARAEKVKAMLVGMGAPATRIRTRTQITEATMYKGHVLAGVTYGFISGNPGEVEERLRTGNITLRFESNNWNINFTPKQKEYFEDLKYYISQRPNAVIAVNGHTDNQGPEKLNKRISRKRAERVQQYLIENGIPKKNVTAKGFGPDHPVATNGTEEGRAKNRRVEITIKQ